MLIKSARISDVVINQETVCLSITQHKNKINKNSGKNSDKDVSDYQLILNKINQLIKCINNHCKHIVFWQLQFPTNVCLVHMHAAFKCDNDHLLKGLQRLSF